MKARRRKKESKSSLNFALVCQKIASQVIDSVTGALKLQEEIDEYQRAISDLLITVASGKEKAGLFLEHGTVQQKEIGFIFKKIWELQDENAKLRKENADLREKSRSGD